MSEFLAEASVLIRPNTAGFRTTLIAELTKATRGIVVPIPVLAQAKGAQTAVAANKAVAASAAQATTATKVQTSARTQQIIADREAAAAEANLAEAQRLTAAAAQRTAAIETAGVRSTTQVAAARAELRAANVAVTASQKAVDASLLKGADAAQADAIEQLRLAVALRQQAIASEEAAAGTVVNTRATAAAIRRNEQLRRGIEANTLELFKIRGATLAASSGFLLGAAAVTIVAKAVEEANKEIEAAARVEKVFGENAVELEHNARGMAESFGLSATQALKLEGQIGNILQVSGIANDVIPKMSEDLVKLAADLSAFNDVPIEQTQKAIALGLVGNSRGLRAYGIELGAAVVNSEALRASGKKSTDELTREDRVLARRTLLFEQTSNAQGAAARRQDSLAQSSKVLKAEITNLGAAIGTKLVPFLRDAVKAGTDVASILQDIGDKAQAAVGKLDQLSGGNKGHGIFTDIKNFATTNAFKQFDNMIASFHRFQHEIRGDSTDLDKLHEAAVKAFRSGDPTIFDKELIKIAGNQHDLQVGFNELHKDQAQAFETKGIIKFIASLEDLQKAALATSRALSAKLGGTLATLQDQMVGIQIAGGDSTAQLANLAKQERTAQAAVAAAGITAGATRGGPGHDTAVKALRERRKDLLDIIEQERSIRQQMADDAVAGAQKISDAVQAAADQAQKLMDEADQATIDLISALAGKLDFAQLRADATTSLQDNLALQNAIQASIQNRIALAKNIIDVKLRTATLHELRVELLRSQIEEKALNKQIEANAQERKRQRIARAGEAIDLDIEFAQINKNKSAELKAHKAKVRFLTIQMSHTKEGTNEWKRLRNERAKENAAIKELNKELGKQINIEKQLEFTFLQRQAGFAANLLSNLIPTAALAGTVGGTVGAAGAISTSTRLGQSGRLQRRGLGDFTQVRGGVSHATQTHVAQRGASMSQMATLIHIQRGMLGVLNRLVGQRTHPEASHQRTSQATALDTYPTH